MSADTTDNQEAAEPPVVERRYTIYVTGSGWFDVTAEDDDDAANVAEQLLAFGSNPVEEWLSIEVSNIERDDD